jgi:phosphoribosylamine---glycine ligase
MRELRVGPMPSRPTVLIIGKDARTDALVALCSRSPHKPKIVGISENHPPGMLENCSKFYGDVSLTDVDAILQIVDEVEPDLVIIGPEEPLCVGIVDKIEDRFGIPCFGPRESHARIEANKGWARDLLETYSIAGNPRFRIFKDPIGLGAYLTQLGDFVVKPDGLTGGKGVKVSGEHLLSVQEGVEYAMELLEQDGVVVVEEKLEGEEFSLQSITDGKTVIHCPLVQDHKRADEGDTGPNTGGMGSYSCPDFSLPFLSAEDVQMAQEVNERVIKLLGRVNGSPYRGVLYGGFMVTAEGLRVIEFNARFGDPEAINVLSILNVDLLEVCWASATDRLDSIQVSFDRKATVCKYVVPYSYPGGKGAGDPIELSRSDDDENLQFYWAAVNSNGNTTLMTGSRALAVVGVGATLETAEATAEMGTSMVAGPVRHRKDIGSQALVDQRIKHIELLRHDDLNIGPKIRT